MVRLKDIRKLRKKGISISIPKMVRLKAENPKRRTKGRTISIPKMVRLKAVASTTKKMPV